MAQKLNAETELGAAGTDPQHNAKARTEIIHECAQQMLQIKKERADLNERAGEVRQRLKDANIQTAAFDYALRVAGMEDAARDAYMDSLKECFAGMSIGEQLDFITAMGDDDDKPAGGTIAEEGYQAGLGGVDAIKNPYKDGSDAATTWLDNWKKGQAAAVNATIGKPNGRAKAPATAQA